MGADLCRAEKLNRRFNDGVGRNHDIRVDDAAFRTEDGDAGKHQFVAFAVAQHGVEAR